MRLQAGNIFLCHRIFIHTGIHRRADDDRCLRCQQSRRKQIVSQAMRHFRQNIGSSRSHYKNIGPIGKSDMLDIEFLIAVPHRRRNSVAADFFKGQWCDELLGMLGHNDTHLGPLLAQTADQIDSFINGDTAGNA